ncbi:MAG: HAMP domain-containing histidine kinase [Clostridiales Family XIII bacterium]|jgi:signal transduction histidine kinase|nr:HAMP domain-containing histidine kinase [Clostridiales Family XIII bacterium]
MLKKLRNKLLFFNMLSLALVIVASFAVIYFMQFQHTRSVDEKSLAAIPSDVMTNAMLAEHQDVDTPSGGARSGEEGITEGNTKNTYVGRLFTDIAGPDLPVYYSNYFVLNTDVNGTLSVFSRMDLSEEEYISAATRARGNDGARRPKTGDVKLNGSHWLYSYIARIPDGLVFDEDSIKEITLDGLPVNESIVFLNIDASDDAMKRLLISMFIIGGCVLVGLFLISLVFSNRALRPTEESLRRQRQFIADASHELKTPLAIIDANAEVALSEPDEAGLWVGRIADESGRMRGLIDDLLFLARSEDAADVPMERLPVDISMAVEQEIDRVEAVLFERGIGVAYQKPADAEVIVNADSSRVRQIILILLDNAMKYTDRGGRITVETGSARKHGFIKISNTGEGISPDDLPHVFDRFYRANKARTSMLAPENDAAASPGAISAHGGYGLGLSIARALVERAGGRIAATSSDGLTSFTVEFPLT